MARTKGAKDAKPRRKPDPRNAHKPSTTPASKSGQTTPPVRTAPPAASTSGPERPAIPPDDFRAAIAAELGEATEPQVTQPGQTAGTDSPPGSLSPAPAAFDPAALTLDGLASAWQLPFYGLAKLLQVLKIAPDPQPIITVGKRRAKELARPSYAIYEQLLTQYLGANPQNTLHAAGGVTALNAVGILPDIIDAIGESRRRSALKGLSPDSRQTVSPA